MGPHSLYLRDFKLSSSAFFFISFTTSQAFLPQNYQATLFLSTKTHLSMLASCPSKPSLHSQVFNTSQISITIFYLQTFGTFPYRSLLKMLKLALLRRLSSHLATRTQLKMKLQQYFTINILNQSKCHNPPLICSFPTLLIEPNLNHQALKS